MDQKEIQHRFDSLMEKPSRKNSLNCDSESYRGNVYSCPYYENSQVSRPSLELISNHQISSQLAQEEAQQKVQQPGVKQKRIGTNEAKKINKLLLNAIKKLKTTTNNPSIFQLIKSRFPTQALIANSATFIQIMCQLYMLDCLKEVMEQYEKDVDGQQENLNKKLESEQTEFKKNVILAQKHALNRSITVAHAFSRGDIDQSIQQLYRNPFRKLSTKDNQSQSQKPQSPDDEDIARLKVFKRCKRINIDYKPDYCDQKKLMKNKKKRDQKENLRKQKKEEKEENQEKEEKKENQEKEEKMEQELEQ